MSADQRIKLFKAFMRGVALCKKAVEDVRKDGYNDIDYVLERIEARLKARTRP